MFKLQSVQVSQRKIHGKGLQGTWAVEKKCSSRQCYTYTESTVYRLFRMKSTNFRFIYNIDPHFVCHALHLMSLFNLSKPFAIFSYLTSIFFERAQITQRDSAKRASKIAIAHEIDATVERKQKIAHHLSHIEPFAIGPRRSPHNINDEIRRMKREECQHHGQNHERKFHIEIFNIFSRWGWTRGIFVEFSMFDLN